MKNGRFSDAQIMGILKQAEGGVPVSGSVMNSVYLGWPMRVSDTVMH